MYDDQIFPSNEENAEFSQNQELPLETSVELSDEDLASAHGGGILDGVPLVGPLLGGLLGGLGI